MKGLRQAQRGGPIEINRDGWALWAQASPLIRYPTSDSNYCVPIRKPQRGAETLIVSLILVNTPLSVEPDTAFPIRWANR